MAREGIILKSLPMGRKMTHLHKNNPIQLFLLYNRCQLNLKLVLAAITSQILNEHA